ncbi:MAG: Efflux ABC transporter, ATP-binding protein, partial [uncultured Corynebacteriales bacterium]
DRGPRPDQALRRRRRGGRPDLRRASRAGHRLPRPQRRRQVDDHAHGARARPAQCRAGARRRARDGDRGRAAQARRGAARPRRGPPRPLGPRPPAGGRPHRRPVVPPGRRGPRAGRPRQGGPPSGEGLLAGHAAAARDRHRAARRPGRAHVRRAGERARPRRCPVGPGPAAPARRRRTHGPVLEPPDERGPADRRPPGHHRARAPHRRRHHRGGAARTRRRAGAGAGAGHRAAVPGAAAARPAGPQAGRRRARGAGAEGRGRGAGPCPRTAGARADGGRAVPRGRLRRAHRQQRGIPRRRAAAGRRGERRSIV